MTEARAQNVPLAMAALLTETTMLMVIATVAKWFAADVSAQVFLLFRYVFCLPLLAAVSLWQFRLDAFVVADRRAFALRSLFGLLGLSCWIFAVSRIEITRATALSQTLPVFITLLAPLILGERVGIRRWAAVGVGLAGAMILLRPDLKGWLQPGIAYAVAAPFFAALMFLYLRKLGATDSPVKTALLYNLLGGAVFSAWCLAGDFNWPTTGKEYAALVACGTMASFQQWLLAFSHKLAPASTLAPLHYFSVPLSIVIGIALFDEAITLTFVIGTSVIVGSTYYILVRERSRPGP